MFCKTKKLLPCPAGCTAIFRLFPFRWILSILYIYYHQMESSICHARGSSRGSFRSPISHCADVRLSHPRRVLRPLLTSAYSLLPALRPGRISTGRNALFLSFRLSPLHMRIWLDAVLAIFGTLALRACLRRFLFVRPEIC